MKTDYTIIRPDGTEERGTIDWPPAPGIHELWELLEPLVGGYPERVNVLHNDEYFDMFVNETGHLIHLERNERATEIYRNNYLKQYPGTDPESMSWIVGVAVLFDRKVWF